MTAAMVQEANGDLGASASLEDSSVRKHDLDFSSRLKQLERDLAERLDGRVDRAMRSVLHRLTAEGTREHCRQLEGELAGLKVDFCMVTDQIAAVTELFSERGGFAAATRVMVENIVERVRRKQESAIESVSAQAESQRIAVVAVDNIVADLRREVRALAERFDAVSDSKLAAWEHARFSRGERPWESRERRDAGVTAIGSSTRLSRGGDRPLDGPCGERWDGERPRDGAREDRRDAGDSRDVIHAESHVGERRDGLRADRRDTGERCQSARGERHWDAKSAAVEGGLRLSLGDCERPRESGRSERTWEGSSARTFVPHIQDELAHLGSLAEETSDSCRGSRSVGQPPGLSSLLGGPLPSSDEARQAKLSSRAGEASRETSRERLGTPLPPPSPARGGLTESLARLLTAARQTLDRMHEEEPGLASLAREQPVKPDRGSARSLSPASGKSTPGVPRPVSRHADGAAGQEQGRPEGAYRRGAMSPGPGPGTGFSRPASRSIDADANLESSDLLSQWMPRSSSVSAAPAGRDDLHGPVGRRLTALRSTSSPTRNPT